MHQLGFRRKSSLAVGENDDYQRIYFFLVTRIPAFTVMSEPAFCVLIVLLHRTDYNSFRSVAAGNADGIPPNSFASKFFVRPKPENCRDTH